MKKQLKQNDTFSSEFSIEEINTAINELKCGKTPGLDKLFAEFFKNFGINTRTWLVTFFNEILKSGRLLKIFKRSKVIAVVKPGKDGSEASHFRHILLLSIAYKLLERLLLNLK